MRRNDKVNSAVNLSKKSWKKNAVSFDFVTVFKKMKSPISEMEDDRWDNNYETFAVLMMEF